MSRSCRHAFSVALFVHYFYLDQSLACRQECPAKTNKFFHTFHYLLLLCLLLILYARCFIDLTTRQLAFDQATAINAVSALWTFMSISSAWCIWRLMKNMSALSNQIGHYSSEYDMDNQIPKFQRRATIAGIFIIVYSITQAVISMATQGMNAIPYFPTFEEYIGYIPNKVAGLIVMITSQMFQLYPIALLNCTSNMMVTAMRHCKEKSDQLTEGKITERAIKSIHRKFDRITIAVDIIAGVYSPFCLISYIGMVAASVLIIFALIKTNGYWFGNLVLIFWLISSAIPILGLSYPSITMNDASLDLLKSLLRIECNWHFISNVAAKTQISILIDYVSKFPVILTAWDFFVMDRAALGAVFSLITTYLLIVIQFDVGSTVENDTSNVTAIMV